MPRCLRCNKKFASRRAVLAHMNQPLGYCHQLYTYRATGVTMAEELKRYRRRNTFNNDAYAHERVNNIYYPFASRDEWELGCFLLQSNLSMVLINQFLNLALIKQLNLSFHTAKQLRGRAEMLPTGPEWKCKPWTTNVATKTKVDIYYRNSLDSIQSLLVHPLVKDFINFTPMRIFNTAAKTMRVYSEWMTGEAAWSMQEQIPAGATLIGTILSSDKTNISRMTGGRVAHPLLLSLANIDMEFRAKASNHAFLLLALLPVPKFLHQDRKIRGVLENRLIHECLDFILAPVKRAAQIGIMMSDPVGNLRYTFPGLAAYIVDTPESAVLAGVAGRTSSVTMASYKQFGDSFRHEPRTACTTLGQLESLEQIADPWNLETYTKLALTEYRLNGVHRPFWRDWPMAEPSKFLMPEPLHHWHKFFWDHDVKWCIFVVGSHEIDFRFSVLQPHTGYRHFGEGISKLRQVTGREHRNIQRHIVAVVAGAVPKRFLVAIRALMDLRYMAQAPQITEDTCRKIELALKEFHDHKDAIVAAGARQGKGDITKDWGIPKLEFLQSIVPNIRDNGAAIQWSADTTERAHITEIKQPSESSNNKNYEPQICRYLDRADKCRRFNLATSIYETSTDPSHDDDNDFECLEHPEAETCTPDTNTSKDYFKLAVALQQGLYPDAPLPFRTFLDANTAIHVTRDPSYNQMSVNQVAEIFHLPDLRGALIDYLTKADGSRIGGLRRVANSKSHLPANIKALEVWTKFRIQNRSYFSPHSVLPAQTINVFPPSDTWKFGNSDTVLINIDPKMLWPQSGFNGHHVAQIRLIFRIVNSNSQVTIPGTDCFLVYAQRFDIIPQINEEISGSSSQKGPYPDPTSKMFILKRARRSNQAILGDVIPLSQVRNLVELTPRFGVVANVCLTKETVIEYSTEFLLNKYLDKEQFYAFDQI